jgi:DNA-binding CsgD family transcriptional regulator
MHEGLHSLSGREIEVLRLLLAGHDAKSVACELGLSVHTVNDRLRDARRKLGVSSSREAARLLAEAEQQSPNFLGGKKFGWPGSAQTVNPAASDQLEPYNLAGKKMGLAGASGLTNDMHAGRGRGLSASLAWLAGGMVVMAMIVAAFIPSSALRNESAAPVMAATLPGPPAIDLMPIADSNGDGRVTADEYQAFSRQGWEVVSEGKDQVQWAELDQMEQVTFLGIAPNAQGAITRTMYIDAIPNRFAMFDRDGDGALSSDEINGRAFER